MDSSIQLQRTTNAMPQIQLPDQADVNTYRPEKGEWLLMAGDGPKDSIPQGKDFQLAYSGISGLTVTRRNHPEYGQSDYLTIRYNHWDMESNPGYFQVRTVCSPNAARDKSGDRIKDEHGNIIYEITWAAMTLINGLYSHYYFANGLQNAAGLLTVHGHTSSFINTYALNPLTNEPQKLTGDYIGRQPLEIQGAIAELQHLNGFPGGIYPMPVLDQPTLTHAPDASAALLNPVVM